MKRRILTMLVLLALTVAISAGLVHAQDAAEAEQPPYRIDLHPGWNLISFPGDPMDAAVENVIGDSQVNVVLAYQADEWDAAVRKTEGGWRTTSGFTAMSGSRGYWVHATGSGFIEAALSPDTPRPSLKGCGWGLMAVWDAEQRPAGTEIDADDYFSESWWRVAYGFLADENLWTKQLPGIEGTVETGAGYWVWSSCPSSCPPYSKNLFDTTTNQWETPVRRGGGAIVEVAAGYRAQVLGGVALSCP